MKSSQVYKDCTSDTEMFQKRHSFAGARSLQSECGECAKVQPKTATAGISLCMHACMLRYLLSPIKPIELCLNV